MSGKGDALLLPRDAAWAHSKGQRVEEGAVDTPSTASAACDPLDIAGKGWQGRAMSAWTQVRPVLG